MKAVLFFALFMLAGFAQAQEDRLVSVDLKSTGYFIGTTFRALVTPQVTWSRPKHTLGVGPALLLVNEGAIAGTRLPKLVGLQGNYRFYPNGTDKRVNLYFFDELNIQRIKDQWTAVAWNTTGQQYQSYGYINREYIIQNTAGYGIELSLSQRWSLYQGVGVGFYYSKVDGDEETDGAPEIEDNNENGYSPFGFSWGIHLGLRRTL